MDIWDIIEYRNSDDSDIDYIDEEEKINKPITYEDIINALINCKLIKKYTLPTPEEALKDLKRILSSQKFRIWRLVSNKF
tara:strand:- start:1069 stop:1308 length:240 start_codon:yes stop_codon:yes gene_type:complete